MVSTAIILFCTCAAFVAGFIDSIAGGGGLITIPALLLSGLPPQLALGTNKVGCCPGTGSFLILALHWVLRISLIEASATSKVMNFASNLGAMILFIWNGAVIWSVGLPMMAANIAGNWLGSRLAIKVGTEAVRRFLWVSLSLLLATLIWRFFISPYLIGA